MARTIKPIQRGLSGHSECILPYASIFFSNTDLCLGYNAADELIIGCSGYMSPEYAHRGIFSEKSDVYSFGVLLLEIVSGNKNSSFYDEDQQLFLTAYVSGCVLDCDICISRSNLF